MNFLNGITEKMRKASSSMVSENFMMIASLLSEAKSQAREQAQAVSSMELKNAIKKLKSGEALGAEDIQYMRLWIVGDAEGYTGMENSFQEWVDEFKRLEASIGAYENKELSLDELFKVHGVVEDALRIAADIGNFLEKQERVVNFENAIRDTKNLDVEILITILESKLKSPGM
ncbi:MAG: hypothetical protein ABH865_09440 [Candidatus Omnitrophota bacterium]